MGVDCCFFQTMSLPWTPFGVSALLTRTPQDYDHTLNDATPPQRLVVSTPIGCPYHEATHNAFAVPCRAELALQSQGIQAEDIGEKSGTDHEAFPWLGSRQRAAKNLDLSILPAYT